MSEHVVAIMAASIGGASLFAAVVGHRSGDDRRDVRLLAVIGSAMSGLALAVFLSRI